MFKKIYPILMVCKSTTHKGKNIGEVAKDLFNRGLIGFDPDDGMFNADYQHIIEDLAIHDVAKVKVDGNVKFVIKKEEGYINPIDNSIVRGDLICSW